MAPAFAGVRLHPVRTGFRCYCIRLLKAKVIAEVYATESEVIRDGLRALLARDRAVYNWLKEQVGPAYDALKADAARAVSVEGVRAALAAEHRNRTARK